MKTAESVHRELPEETASAPGWNNRFASLGSSFFTELKPHGLPAPHWVSVSKECAELLGLPADWQTRDNGSALQVFSGNAQWPGMRPLASVYSGHQFGVWAGQLGDGRALWLGELNTPNGSMELQLKGAGKTPYSRMGDGRAVLRSSIREFLCSEAMHALGIPTTRALCLTGSALPVLRERLETAAVVTRVAESFIRFGHFEHFAHTAPGRASPAAPGNPADPLRALADFVIDHFYPACRDAPNPCAALLEAVALKTAELMAGWQSVGFCHGVMNTDNMSILGLTIDYGPFGFLDGFDPDHICNHSDHQGRYAFSRQPGVGFWNLHALAQALLPLIGDSDLALAALEPFKAAYPRAFDARMRAKLGLAEHHGAYAAASDRELIDGLLTLMAQDKTDFTIAFRRLAGFRSQVGADNAVVRDLFLDRERFDAWAAAYGQRLRRDAGGGEGAPASAEADTLVDEARAARMNRVNPKYILRNHLAEAAIQQAEKNDFTELHALLEVLTQPFDEHPAHQAYADFPPDWAQHIEVSCSS